MICLAIGLGDATKPYALAEDDPIAVHYMKYTCEIVSSTSVPWRGWRDSRKNSSMQLQTYRIGRGFTWSVIECIVYGIRVCGIYYHCQVACYHAIGCCVGAERVRRGFSQSAHGCNLISNCE